MSIWEVETATPKRDIHNPNQPKRRSRNGAETGHPLSFRRIQIPKWDTHRNRTLSNFRRVQISMDVPNSLLIR